MSRDPRARLATSRHARRGATLVPTAVAEPPASAAADASASADFDWRDKWYPVAFEADLSDDAPMTFTLLGEPLVFWRDHTANAPDGTPTWRCTADKCPHRLVPSLRGTGERTGRSSAATTGGPSTAPGKCTPIPQFPSEGTALDTALASPRSCVTPYPTKLAQGMLWVLPKSTLESPRV